MKEHFCKNKKILLISNMYPSKKYPHYGVFVRNTAESLREKGFRVDCIAIEKTDGKLKKLWAYIHFHLRILRAVVFGGYGCVYAHYISHTAIALMLCRALKPAMKLVVNVHGNDVVPEDAHDEKYLPLVRKIQPSVTTWIAPSEYFKRVLLEQYQVPEEKIVVYPSGGIDCAKFRKKDRETARRQLGLKESDYVISFVGRIEKDKGWDTLTEAVGLLKGEMSVVCLMVGAGDLDAQLEALLDEHGVRDRIRRYPLIPQEDLVDIYNASDLFCLPSYRKSESLALVGLEAMACGCMVLAGNMAGPATYVRDGENGFLFEPRNAADLAAQIQRISGLEDGEKVRIAEAAENTAKIYDRESVKNRLAEVFEK